LHAEAEAVDSVLAEGSEKILGEVAGVRLEGELELRTELVDLLDGVPDTL
jgi:hypothetical protein